LLFAVEDRAHLDIHIPNSASGSAARYDAFERTFERNSVNVGGRSFTTIMPREAGPNASVSVSKDTVPAIA
jgi:hypothetical protein